MRSLETGLRPALGLDWSSRPSAACIRASTSGYYGFQTFSDLLEDAEDEGLIELDYDDSRGNYKVRSKPAA